MAELIDDLLELSRVSLAELDRESVSISVMAQTVADGLQRREPGRTAVFAIQKDLDVDADRGLVRVLLENLIGNAWKFTSKSEGPRIEVGAQDRDGGAVYFVRDNGAGFDMEYAHKLFGPFQRLHSDTEFPGTGIGLATVQRIVERHGGRVWAEGAVGRGATVFFTVPPGVKGAGGGQ
jgi:light-regulated signal transduction histidine kinase (bacteriophytochrome)